MHIACYLMHLSSIFRQCSLRSVNQLIILTSFSGLSLIHFPRVPCYVIALRYKYPP